MPRVLFSFIALLLLFSPLRAETVEEPVATEEDVESNVLTLSLESFDKAIEDNDFILVEFFAPWCGHCKHLAPEYEKAATELVGFTPKIVLAKVDCTVDEDLCSKHNIKGFPTLKFFKSGKPKEYLGGRTAEGIINWIKKKIAPAVSVVSSADELDQLVKEKSEEVVLVAYLDADSEAYKLFDDIAQHDVADKWSMIRAAFEDESNKNKVVVHRPFGEPMAFDTAKEGLTGKELYLWIDENANPYVGEISEQFERLQGRELPIGLIFLDEEETPIADLLEWFTPVAKEYYQKMSFAYVVKKYHARLTQLGASGDFLPTLVVLGNGQTKWPFDESLTFNKENVEKHIESILDGSLPSFIRSDPIPETNDEPVKVVVGKSFDAIVLDETKDVLIEFYAPWCGHCKSLVPVYNQLGEHYKDHESVVIAKVDATANDQNVVHISGYPSIFLFKKGDKSNPIPYNGDRSLEAFISFIDESLNPVETEENPAPKDEL